ncbi:DUF4097 family beta strand repeat-containing protein [Viridibacillus sp. NPDC093762]|uniref:DUF4097 family beta strand repeat-containing protein n=1 Tax=Viridibacillus sp. NPDC093762 TaxID=3390720 RepID=UPI003D004133
MKKFIITSIMLIAIFGFLLSVMHKRGDKFQEEKSYDMEGIKEVVINNESWNLELENSESNKLTVTVEGKQKDKKNNPVSIKNKGKRIIISQQDEDGGFTDNFSFGKKGIIHISIPQNALDTLTVNNSYGDIKMNDIKSKNVIISNDSGTAKIEGLSAEEGRFTSKDGELSLKESSLKNLTSASTSGDNYLMNVNSPNMNITSEDGEVSVKDAVEGKTLLVETKSGDITVAYKEIPTSLKLTANSNSSDITLNLDSLKLDTDTEKSKVGTIGDGFNQMELLSENGTINVK